jgi:uncharacterized protein YjbI with pentapeptide repeats
MVYLYPKRNLYTAPAMPQDYSGQNLRGRSFKGQNLEGANFSGADIRSADFTGANLRNANFSHAKAGLQKRWAIFLVCVSGLLSGVSGFFSFVIGALIIRFILDRSIRESLGADWVILGWISGLIILTVSIVVFIFILHQGFNSATAFAGFISFAIAFAITFVIAIIIPQAPAISTAASGTITIPITFAVTFAGACAFAIGISFAGANAIAIVLGVGTTIAIAFAEAIAMDGFGAFALAFAFAESLFSAYIAWRAMKGDEKYLLIRNIAVPFAAFGGTNFCNANLTDANFTGATLKSTDFRKANLTRACFHKTKKLDRVRPGTTYLQKAQVVSVLVKGQGLDLNFDREDLRGVNFQGSNLVNASFIGADLSEANLQDADLSRAKLVQAQLNGTDLTGAILTGAYIQDWGITTNTKFDGVRCEYVYMRLPTNENPDPLRKPDNNKEVFADGEFGDFIKPIFDTLDLYHNQGVDPRAIAISFKQLAENHPEADLRIVGMEVRGEDKFLLRAKTAATADKSELSAEYFDTYNQLKGLPEGEIKLLLEEKDSRIQSLENFVNQALQRPSFYSSTQIQEVGSMASNPGGFSVGGSVGGNANNVQGDGNSVVQGDTTMTGDRNINTGGGNYNERIERDYIQGNYYAAGQPQSLAQAAADIQMLLKQLEQTYPTTTTSQQMVVAAEAINRIESNPLLKERVINAVKSGGLAAFEKAIDNPAGAFIVGAIKGWQEVDAED